MTLEKVKLENTDTKIWAHSPLNCVGEFCSVHNRSEHKLRKFRQHWRSDRQLMERLCSHGVGHPDPDHMDYVKRSGGSGYEGVHGCDGCCYS